MSATKDDPKCPYCLSPIEGVDDKVRCPKCGVAHHAGCWRANGKCSVYGCDGWVLWNDSITGRLAPETYDNVEISRAQDECEPAGDPLRCMECGRPVKSGTLVCWNCRRRHRGHFFDNCSGPSALFALGLIALAALVLKALV